MAEEKIIIKDKDRYNNYSTRGKTYFDGMMRSMLSVVPIYDTITDSEIKNELERVRYEMAENFAFYATDTYLTITEEIVNEKIEILKNELIVSINNSLQEIRDLISSNKPTI